MRALARERFDWHGSLLFNILATERWSERYRRRGRSVNGIWAADTRTAVPYEPFETVRIDRTDVEVTRLGFGSAPIGGLFREIDDDEAAQTVERAWALGIRYFDVAPLYGYGTAERRLGAVLRDRPRDDYVVSTKVGRLVRPADRIPPGADIDRQALDGRPDAFYAGTERPADRLRLQRRRRPALDRGEPRAARARPDRRGVHPRSGRPLAGRHRGRLSRPCTGSASRASSARSGRA